MKLAAKARDFLHSTGGNVAMMFALATIPLMIGAGVGLDYTRAMLVRQQMSEALDAAALAVGSSPSLDHDSAETLAKKYFNANYTVDTAQFGTPTVSIPVNGYSSTGSVVINATSNMPTMLVKLVGITSLPVTSSSTVVWGQTKLWVSLVLDNSGSMANGDASGTKMDALRNASHQLLTILQNAASTPGDVQVSIIPFVHLVNVGTTNVGAAWIDWSDWNSPPIQDQTNYIYQTDNDATLNGNPLKSFGPGDSCPFTSGMGYLCNANPTNNSNCSPTNSAGCINAIPSSGSYKGYICPSMHKGGTQDGLGYRFYNGCWTGVTWDNTYTTVATGSSATCSGHSTGNGNCTCSGSFAAKTCKTKNYPHTWTVNAHTTWGGCIMDRKQDFDTSNTAPTSGNQLFPAVNNLYCGTAAVASLGYDWTALGNQVDKMAPFGATNQAIGIAHGWQSLTPGAPYGAPSVPSNTTRYMIILSDGLNTMDRWWGDGSTEGSAADDNIDAREKATCDHAKADGIVIYTIFLDIGGTHGNSAPLQYCASDNTKYFDLTDTSGVVTTFNQIAQQITNVRLSR